MSQTGSDSNKGLSRLSALKTTAAAVAKLAPDVRLNFTAVLGGPPPPPPQAASVSAAVLDVHAPD